MDYENRFEAFRALNDIGKTILVSDNDTQFQYFDQLIDAMSAFANETPNKWFSFGESYVFWLYFRELEKNKDISAYLLHLKKRQDSETSDKTLEVLDFLEIEVLMSKGSVNDSNEGRIKELYQKYPFNTDFKHSYAHVAKKRDKEEALRLYKECIKDWGCKELIRRKGMIMEPGKSLGTDFAEYLVMNTHDIELGICKEHFENREYDQAKERLNQIKIDPAYENAPLLSVTNQSFENLIYTREYIDAEARAKQGLIEQEVKDLNKTNVETLGVFSAIITFIITAALAMFKDESALSPIYMIGIGLTLIVFILTMQLTSNPIQLRKEDGKGGFFELFCSDLRVGILSIYTLLIVVIIGVTAYYVQPKKHEIENLVERAKIELSAESNVQLSNLRRNSEQIAKTNLETLEGNMQQQESLFENKIVDLSQFNVKAFESEVVEFKEYQEVKFKKELANMGSLDVLSKDTVLEDKGNETKLK